MDENATTPADSWLTTLAPGSQVWWNDPDEGFSSGYYTVIDILADEPVDSRDTVLFLKNEAGSQAEVYAFELSPTPPEKQYSGIGVTDHKQADLAGAHDAS